MQATAGMTEIHAAHLQLSIATIQCLPPTHAANHLDPAHGGFKMMPQQQKSNTCLDT